MMTPQRFNRWAVLALAAATMLVTSCSTNKVYLHTHSSFSSDLPGPGAPIRFIAEQINIVSNGTLEMEYHEPDKKVGQLEVFEAVSSGEINSGYATAGYWADKLPAAALFSTIPFGPEAIEYMAWLYYDDGLELWQEVYDNAGHNVKVVPCAIITADSSGWFKERITRPEQLQGLRMRFFNLGGKVMERLGAKLTLLDGPATYEALKNGQLDAAEYSMPSVDEHLRLHEVAKYHYFPGWHQQSTMFELLINKDTWNSMDAQQQAVVEAVCKASMTDSLAKTDAAQAATLKRHDQREEVSIEFWNDKMLEAFRSAWHDYVILEEQNDPGFRKVWEDLAEFRADYAIWLQTGFMPR